MLGNFQVRNAGCVSPDAPSPVLIRGTVVRWTVRVLALAATAVATYLTWISWQSGNPSVGCGGLPLLDCEHVLASRWSSWLGVPVSLPAAGVYGLIFASLLVIGPKVPPWLHRAAWVVLIPLLVLAAGAALWFIVLLLFVIHKLCLYCLIVHGCGLAIGTLILMSALSRHRREARRGWAATLRTLGKVGPSEDSPRPTPAVLTRWAVWSLVTLGLAGTTMLIGGQLLFPPKQYRLDVLANVAPGQFETRQRDTRDDVDSPGPEVSGPDSSGPSSAADPGSPAPVAEPIAAEPTPGRKPGAPGIPESKTTTADTEPSPTVQIVDGRIRLDPHDHPILGDPDAKYVVVKLFDYSCRHCRTLHSYLEEARRRYGEQLAVVVLPVPMNTKCNKYVQSTHPDHRNACDYTKLALAVWRLAPAKFAEYHHWLLEPSRPPPEFRAENRAAELAGREALKREREGRVVAQRVRDYNRLYYQSGGRTVPKMILGKHVITGEAASAQEVFDLLERLLDIKPLEP